MLQRESSQGGEIMFMLSFGVSFVLFVFNIVLPFGLCFVEFSNVFVKFL